MLEAYRRYLFGFSRVVMLSQMAQPGEGITHYQYATAWPCGQLLAQSFHNGADQQGAEQTLGHGAEGVNSVTTGGNNDVFSL